MTMCLFIKGYEYHYSVNSNGVVYTHKNGKMRKKSLYKDKNGYLTVSLYKKGLKPSVKKGSDMYQMKTQYVTDKKIYEGMYEVARKRSDKAEAEAKKEAWAYLHKYIEHFWD